MNVSNEYLLSLKIAKQSLLGLTEDYPEDTNWGEVRREMSAQGIIGLADVLTDNEHIPDSVREKLSKDVSMIEVFCLKTAVLCGRLTEIMSKNGIPFAIMKGLAAAKYYPRPESRMMGDVDFIVSPEDFDRADKVLLENGFKTMGEPQYRHNEYIYGGVVFELHRQLSKNNNEVQLNIIDKKILEAIPRVEQSQLMEMEFPTLPELENGLVLLQHTQNHLARGLGLRHILDWVVYVNSVLDDQLWEKEFQSIAKEAGLEELAKVTAKMGQLYLGLPEENHKWCSDIDESVAEALAEYIFESGNFGNKQDSTLSESLEDVKVHGGFFKSLQFKGLNSGWKAMEKHPSLKNFAWLYQGLMYIKRKTSQGKLIKDVTGGIKRHHRYKKLSNLFDDEDENSKKP